MLKIPLSDIDLGEEEILQVTTILKSKWLSLGEVTKEFEEQFAKYIGVKHAVAVSSGTSALHLAHRALGVEPGDEVLVPSFTFVATVNSILYTGATPVFVDITSMNDLNICVESIAGKITANTKGITLVHYAGYPCDMDVILEFARENRLFIIEDAAHAPGAEYRGNKVGGIGDIGCFSFFSNKNLVTGEGGMIVTNNATLAERIRFMRSHGMTALSLDKYKGHAYTYDVVALGYNYRIDEIRSALGLVQLQKLEANNQRRANLAELYRQNLAELEEITIPFSEKTCKSSHHLFPMILPEQILRSDLISALRNQGVQTSIHYPPVHQFSYYRDNIPTAKTSLPITEAAGKRELTLPMFPLMSESDIEYVVSALKKSL